MQELFKVVSVGGGVGGEECGERCVRGRCVGGMWGKGRYVGGGSVGK